MDYRSEAKYFIDQGINVGPLRDDGSKLPKIRWKFLQDRFMSNEEVEKHFLDCGGIFAVTGKISNLFLFDFDTKYDRPGENTFDKFIKYIPEDLIKKFSINSTRSGGRHIWVRTPYSDRSRKITRRDLTLPEFCNRVKLLMDNGANEKTAMNLVLKAPFEVVLETRGNKSYGVISHVDYDRLQRSNRETVTKDEMEFLLNIGYSLDCGFVKSDITYTGKSDDYRCIKEFNEDCTAEGMIGMLEASGLYQSIGMDHNGNYQMSRTGSSSKHSGYVYDSGILKIFGTNLFNTQKDVLTPFDVYAEINNFTKEQAISMIKLKRDEGV